MKTSVNFSSFCDAFGPFDRDDNFSFRGKRALFDYLEALEEDMGEELELDVIALCCEYTEYGSVLDAAQDFDADISNDAEARELLEDRTSVIDVVGGGVIIQNF